MSELVSYILGALTSILGCWVFWRYLLFVQPKVCIAPKIAVSYNDKTGKNVYRFKVINMGKHQVIGITFHAWVCDLLHVPGGKITHLLCEIPINNSATKTLAGKVKEDRPWGLKAEVIFRSEIDFDLARMLMEPETRVMVTLRASDALSGTTVVQQRTYVKDDIEAGWFRIGHSFEIES